MTVENPTSFSRADRLLIAITWLTYASFYLGRLNISPTLPVIADDLGIGLGRVGLLGTIFFVSYALGQFIVGQIGNILNPRLIIFAGLVIVSLANILFSTQSSLLILAILWAVNGFAQAMGWGPMLRILSSQLNPAQLKRISVFFSISFQIGTAVAWGLAGFLLTDNVWQNAFLIPGIILLIVSLLWLASGINVKEDSGVPADFNLPAIVSDVKQLFPILITTACTGFIYIGILLWLPTLMREWQFIPDGFSQLTTALVPLVGIPGMLIAGVFLARQFEVKRTILVFLFVLLACLTLSYFTSSIIQGLLVLATVMVASGLAGLLLSSAPLLLSDKSRVSSAGGLLTAAWSAAGGLSGIIIGTVAENAGWSMVLLLWLGVAIGAIISLFIFSNTNLRELEEFRE